MVSYNGGLRQAAGRTLRRGLRNVARRLQKPIAYAAGPVIAGKRKYNGPSGKAAKKMKMTKKKRMNRTVRVTDFMNTNGSLYRKGSEKTLKRWYKDGIRLRWKYTDSQTYVSGNGVQAVNVLPVSIFTRSDIDTITDKIVAAVPTGLPSLTTEYGLKKVTHTLQLKNQTNDEIEVWLYFCLCKKDIPTGALGCSSAWDIGVDDQTGTSGTPFDFPYAEPRESELFKESYEVVRKVCYRMKSGTLAIDTFKFTPNKILSEDYLKRFDTIGGYKGLSMNVMMVQLGPIGRKVGVAGKPTYGPSRVDVIQNVNYYLLGCSSRRTAMTETKTLDLTAGNIVAMTDADETANNIAYTPA